MRFLARREYSACELRDKLVQREFSDAIADQALSELARQNLQSDARYAEVFVRSKVTRGTGRFRIERELEQKGVASGLIREAITDADCDWFDLALQTYRKKYKSTDALDFREKARRFRYMTSRGFDHEQINYAIEQAGREDESF